MDQLKNDIMIRVMGTELFPETIVNSWFENITFTSDENGTVSIYGPMISESLFPILVNAIYGIPGVKGLMDYTGTAMAMSSKSQEKSFGTGSHPQYWNTSNGNSLATGWKTVPRKNRNRKLEARCEFLGATPVQRI